MKKIAMAAAAACLVVHATAWAQVLDGSWRIAPQLGLALHGGYYDDLVVTTFADGDVDTDLLGIDPDLAIRIGMFAEYAATGTVSLYGGLAGSWPEADVAVKGLPRADIDFNVIELSAGALVRLGEWGGAARVIPFYVGGDLSFVWHSFDDLFWQGQRTDVTTTSVGLSAKFGVEYPIGTRFSLRGEARQLLIRGAFGGLEDELAAAAARDEGKAAQTDLDGSMFSVFMLNAGLVILL